MSDTKKLLENYQSNLNESNEINDMTMEEMIDEYSNMCENAGLSIKEAIQQLNEYDCLNTGSFRNALSELREYLNS